MKRELIALYFLAALCGSAHADQWLTFGGNAARSGVNVTEDILNTNTVQNLTLAWQWAFSGPILTQPLYASGVSINDGGGNVVPTDLVYAADLNGEVMALNVRNGLPVWITHVPSEPVCNGGNAPANILNPTVGVVGTPTIDQKNNRMFLVAADGTLWALALDTGIPLNGYPLQVLPPSGPEGGPLAFGSPTYDSVNGVLYIGSAGLCEVPNYQGELVQVAVGTDNTTTPSVLRTWVTTPSAPGGGIWGPGGVSIDNFFAIYAATGNAFTTPEDSEYAEHVIKLDGNLNVVAAHGPALTGADVDFGATPLPFDPPGCPPMLAAMNKSGKVFIYNRSGTAISNGPLQVINVTEDAAIGGFLGIPTYDPVSNQLFFGNNSDSTAIRKFRHGLIAMLVEPNCSLALHWSDVLGPVSSQGVPVVPVTVANGVIYYSSGVAGVVYAIDPEGHVLWQSPALPGGVFAAPTVVNGLVLVSDYSGNIWVFYVPPA